MPEMVVHSEYFRKQANSPNERCTLRRDGSLAMDLKQAGHEDANEFILLSANRLRAVAKTVLDVSALYRAENFLNS
jgi:hypothetical protein